MFELLCWWIDSYFGRQSLGLEFFKPNMPQGEEVYSIGSFGSK